MHWSLKTLIVLAVSFIGGTAFHFFGPMVGLPVSVGLLFGLAAFFRSWNLALVTISGGMMGLGWPDIGSAAPLLLIGLVPMLYMEHRISLDDDGSKGSRIFLLSYVGFLVFNSLACWWVWYASAEGVAMEVLLNSLFMAIVFKTFSSTKKALGEKAGYLSLLFYWLAFEYIHLRWDFTFPWLNLGNGFANYPSFVQWYEFTGHHGGTLWILLINLLVLKLVIAVRHRKQMLFSRKQEWAALGFLLIVPLSWSVWRYNTYQEGEETTEVVVVQPNVDPYNEKFSGSWRDQMETMLTLAESKITPETEWVAFPETALQEPVSLEDWGGGNVKQIGLWEETLENSASVTRFNEFVGKYPGLNLVSGMTSYELYARGETPTITARNYGNSGMQYDVYNSALHVGANRPVGTYAKSKPLIGVEYMPLQWLFKPIEHLIWNMGGTTGSLGTQEEREVFTDAENRVVVAPVICYESLYGEFVGEFIRGHEANVLFIITNDGWWDNTPGHRQHLHYASLRAIEHRRSIARSANTGVSCFVNQVGDLSQETDWWVPDARRAKLALNRDQTFYTQFGDYLGRSAAWVAFFIWIYALVMRFKKRFDPLAPRKRK